MYLQQVYGVAANMGDDNLQNDLEAAERAGMAQGEQPDACDYWKKNPEAVATMRQEAALMLQAR